MRRAGEIVGLEYRDTLDLRPRSHGLLKSLLGKTHDGPFHVGTDVDAVSGATFSSRAIALASLNACTHDCRSCPEVLEASRLPAPGPGWMIGARVAAEVMRC